MIDRLHDMLASGELQQLWSRERHWCGLHLTFVDGSTGDSLEYTMTSPSVALARLQPADYSEAQWYRPRGPFAVHVLQGSLELRLGVELPSASGRRLATTTMVELPAGGSFAFDPSEDAPWLCSRALGEDCYAVALYGDAVTDDGEDTGTVQRPLTVDEFRDLHAAFGDLLAWNR